jgi:hypothetical protein
MERVVRCPSCEAVQSQWAARCTECGADLGAAPELAELPKPRRRYGLVAVIGALLAGVITLAVVHVGDHRAAKAATDSGGGDAAALPEQPGTTAAIAAPVPINVVSVDPSGALVEHNLMVDTSRVLAPDAAGWPEGPATVGVRTVYLSGGLVYEVGRAAAIYPPPAGATDEGEADELIPVNGPLAAGDGGQVWVETGAGGLDQPEAVLLDQYGDDWTVAGRVQLDPGERAVAAIPGALITADSAGRIRQRVTSTGEVTLSFDGLSGAQSADDVIGAADRFIAFVACGVEPSCPILVEWPGSHRTIRPPAGAFEFIAGGAVDANGLIAAFAATGPAQDPSAELVLVNGVTGTSRVVTAPIALGDPVGAAAWGPTGRWLVFGAVNQTYLLDTATMGVTRLPFTAGYGFTTTPCC